MKKEKITAKGAEALFGAALTYAFSGVLVREMGLMWGDKAQVAARWILVAVFLVIYGLFKKYKPIPKDKLKYAVILSFVFAGMVLFFTFSVQKTTIANAMFTFYAANMISAFILGSLFMREKVTRNKFIALLLALAGLSVYSGALIAGSLGILFGVIAGVFGGLSNVMQKLLAGVDRNAVLRLQYGLGTVFVLLLTLLSKDEILRDVNGRGMLATILFAIILIVAGNLLLYGFQHFDVNVGSVIMSTEIVFAAALGFIFYKEVPSAHEFLGGFLILAGSVVGSLKVNTKTSRTKH